MAVTSSTPYTAFEARFKQARDLRAFAESILDAANAGDGASRYWLYRALEECLTSHSTMTLEEVLAQEAEQEQEKFDPEPIREWFTRCEGLRASNGKGLGEADAWLQRAVEAGYPMAQMQKALVLAVHMKGNTENAERMLADARALALKGLKSGEPAALAMMARVAVPMLGGLQSASTADSWLLAACLRGLECGTHSEYFEVWCKSDPACQPFETGVDLLRRGYGAEFDSVESQARLINEQIDAGRFDELGF